MVVQVAQTKKRHLYKSCSIQSGLSKSPVRTFAADALGKMGDKANKSIPALIQALKDKEKDVRKSAKKALKAIRGK